MALYDEIRERFKGKKDKPKKKETQEEPAKPAKKPTKKGQSMGKSAAFGAMGKLPKNGEELLMPMGKKGAALGLLFDKFR